MVFRKECRSFGVEIPTTLAILGVIDNLTAEPHDFYGNRLTLQRSGITKFVFDKPLRAVDLSDFRGCS